MYNLLGKALFLKCCLMAQAQLSTYGEVTCQFLAQYDHLLAAGSPKRPLKFWPHTRTHYKK